MGIIDTTDRELARLIHANAKVMAMFTTDQSAACEQLRAVFEQFATNQAYGNIAFLRLPSEASPAARQTMGTLVAPFFVTYSRGCLVYSDTLSTEQQVRGVLHALYAHL